MLAIYANLNSTSHRHSSGGIVYSTDTIARKDLVLIGGGHSHVEALKRFGISPLDGLRLTLIARDVMTPYSGMLPGLIAGQYRFDESYIDLRVLARFAACRIYHAEVQGLDLDRREVLCKNRAPVRFDLLSINIGSRPAVVDVPGAEAYALPVKPIGAFLADGERLIARIEAGRGGVRIAVVGADAGGGPSRAAGFGG